jgi:hypothetical protein
MLLLVDISSTLVPTKKFSGNYDTFDQDPWPNGLPEPLTLRSWLQQLNLAASSPELLESARNNPRVALRPERLLLELLASGHATTSGISSSACLRF